MAFSFAGLRECLLDTRRPIEARTDAAFHLRTSGGEEAVEAVNRALRNRRDSALLRHELAYILGQMRHKSALLVLNEILDDQTDDVMVRHEAAEALGAIGGHQAMSILKHYVNDPSTEVADTCRLSIDLIKWTEEQQLLIGLDNSQFHSIDPAPADRANLALEELRRRLLDASLPLFDRYRAMFSLRNRGTVEAVQALVEGLRDANPLFRHEIAYVFGQMRHPASVPALIRLVEDENEHRMVRHEAAEALGSVGGQMVEEVLTKYLLDKEDVVRESCEVALGIAACWNSDSGTCRLSTKARPVAVEISQH